MYSYCRDSAASSALFEKSGGMKEHNCLNFPLHKLALLEFLLLWVGKLIMNANLLFVNATS